ncbi:MAG TPA: hypothetical protein VG603_13955, partial [Chitinophagales bacterium]|nr:hypothetical protein [Chitinophagales bacterium]
DVTGCSFTYSKNYTGPQGLEFVYFPNEGTNMFTRFGTFAPEAYKMGTNLEKLDIHPRAMNYADDEFVMLNENFYNQIIDYCNFKFQNNNSLAVALKSRFQHQHDMWMLHFNHWAITNHCATQSCAASVANYLLGGVLEITVRQGYDGEGRFFTWVAGFILIFSFIYYRWYKEEIIEFMNAVYNKKKSDLTDFKTLQVYPSVNFWRDYARCIWFSFMAFFDPRLPVTYFNFGDGAFKWVIVEWLIGLGFIILFLIFLASKYAFLRSLISF